MSRSTDLSADAAKHRRGHVEREQSRQVTGGEPPAPRVDRQAVGPLSGPNGPACAARTAQRRRLLVRVVPGRWRTWTDHEWHPWYRRGDAPAPIRLSFWRRAAMSGRDLLTKGDIFG